MKNISRRTYYLLGVVSGALDVLGGALLLLGVSLTLVFNVATVAAGAMMLLLATAREDAQSVRMCALAGALLAILGMSGGAVGTAVAAVCAALAWPVFVWPYFRGRPAEDTVHTMAFLVLLCGGVLLVGSFLPVPQMLAGCIIVAVAAVHGVLAFVLYRQEPPREA